MPNWQRTFVTIWITEFLAIAGFAMVQPFMPYYVMELGITNQGDVAMWSGVAQAAMAIGLAIMAPVWDALSDRFGRKNMVIRATLAGAILMATMGFAANVQQLVLLRLGQGIFTGTVTAATTLVASVVPRERSGQALGSLQTAIYLGSSLGPLMGGVIGDLAGYRQCFWITGAFLFISGILVVFLVHENFTPGPQPAGKRRVNLRTAARFLFASGGALAALLVARALMRAATQVPNPVLPLFVQSLLPQGARIATITGLVTGAAAVSGAIGSPLLGAWGDRIGHRPILILSGLAAGLFYVPLAFVSNITMLVICQIAVGFAIGGTLSSLTALLARSSPQGREGLIFGVDASLLGLASAVGPLSGAAIAAAAGLPAAFILAAGLMVAGTVAAVAWVQPQPSPRIEAS